MQMGVKFKTTNNIEFFPCLRHVAKAKFDIKNDLKDIRANIIRKEPRKYHAFKGIFKGNFYYFNLSSFFFLLAIIMYVFLSSPYILHAHSSVSIMYIEE